MYSQNFYYLNVFENAFLFFKHNLKRMRMGAPITAYNRLSNKQIRVHSNIYDPDYVVVVDETLLDSVNVTEGLKEEGAIIINTKHAKEELLPKLNGYKGRVYTIDARKISLQRCRSRTHINLLQNQR